MSINFVVFVIWEFFFEFFVWFCVWSLFLCKWWMSKIVVIVKRIYGNIYKIVCFIMLLIKYDFEEDELLLLLKKCIK